MILVTKDSRLRSRLYGKGYLSKRLCLWHDDESIISRLQKQVL